MGCGTLQTLRLDVWRGVEDWGVWHWWQPKLYNTISTAETSSLHIGAIVYTAGGGGGLSLARYLTSIYNTVKCKKN